jgi:purine-binding chemotaxis protein CheW
VTPPADITEETEQALPKTAGVCESPERVIAFFLGGQRYALPIERVREIQQIVAFSDVPSGRAGVVGMVNLRGRVIPAVDMRRLVGLDPNEYTLETPMVIAEVRGDVLALIVDEVQDVVELPEDCLQAAPAMHELSANMIGVACLSDGLVYVLDIDALIGAGLFEGSEQ